MEFEPRIVTNDETELPGDPTIIEADRVVIGHLAKDAKVARSIGDKVKAKKLERLTVYMIDKARKVGPLEDSRED